MKRSNNRPEDHDPSTSDGLTQKPSPEAQESIKAAKSSDSPEPGGVSWLRYAGVGPSRKSASKGPQKISGTDVTSLGSLEAEVMGVLWELDRPANGMEVAEFSLYKRRSQSQEPISFATVNTTLRRLANKGLLLCQKGETRTPYYTPTVGREEMAARILNNVSETLLGNSLHGLIPRLVGGLGRGNRASQDRDQEMAQRLLNALQEAADKTPKE